MNTSKTAPVLDPMLINPSTLHISSMPIDSPLFSAFCEQALALSQSSAQTDISTPTAPKTAQPNLPVRHRTFLHSLYARILGTHQHQQQTQPQSPIATDQSLQPNTTSSSKRAAP